VGIPIFGALGFGQMSIEALTVNPPYGLIRVHNSFECHLTPEGIVKPYSHFIRGIIAGYLKIILNAEIKVEEIKCIAKGDAYCLFEAKREA